eukprot:Lankesteria_metandrocarpae@DN5020_c1_g1_i2.p1
MDLGKIAKTYVRTLQEIVKDHYQSTLDQISNNEWADSRIVRKQSLSSASDNCSTSEDDDDEGTVLLDQEAGRNPSTRRTWSNAKVTRFNRASATRIHAGNSANRHSSPTGSQQRSAPERKSREWNALCRQDTNDGCAMPAQPSAINATLALKLSLPGPWASWIPDMHPSILNAPGFSVEKCFMIPHVTTSVIHQGDLTPHCAACQQALSRFRMFSVTCHVCDLTYCNACYGSNHFSKCCRNSGCRACADIVRKHIRFHDVKLPILELGVACTLSLPFDNYFIFQTARRPEDSGPPRGVSVWLSYNADQSKIRWRTLEMRHNVPLDSGELPVGRIADIEEDTESQRAIRIVITRGSFRFWKFEFASKHGVKLAWELFGPQQQKRGV